MSRRRRSFFFDNINRKLLINTFKNTQQVKADVDAEVVSNTSILTKAQVDNNLDNYLQVANSTSFASTSQLDAYLQVANSISLTSFDVITSTPSGNGALSFASSNGSFTFTPADVTTPVTKVYALSGTDIDPANGGLQTKTLSADTTFTESLSNGDSVVLMLNAGASYTVTWPTTTWVTSAGDTAPTLTANDTIVLWKVGSTLFGAYVGSYA